MKFIAGLFLGAGLASAMPQPSSDSWSLSKRNPAPADTLFDRSLPTCAHDNLFRIFLDARYSSSASAFCSTYITSTSVSTIVPLATYTVTARTTDATAFSTVVVMATKTSTTLAPDATITISPNPAKRQVLPGCPGKAGTYPPDRISSACSCLVTPAVIISSTTTASVSTVTVASTLHVTKQATTTQTSTTVVDVTGPPTAVVTIQSSSVLPTGPAWYCTATSGVFTVSDGGAYYVADCATSFIGTGTPQFLYTEASYQACADACSKDGNCYAFSFQFNAASNNCYGFVDGGIGGTNTNVDSGIF
ncbi:uncharacterized protein PAC_00718 [Phialocephala subalpina]|uniref:Apple domain-containing protein n=1 Tax=Phialocephala subalpina TaxID=576137 RepID=A0A1L7WDI6_9HELO|nr:uncharacterized protein PAC_00718 [Phialocephala subalpina]